MNYIRSAFAKPNHRPLPALLSALALILPLIPDLKLSRVQHIKNSMACIMSRASPHINSLHVSVSILSQLHGLYSLSSLYLLVSHCIPPQACNLWGMVLLLSHDAELSSDLVHSMKPITNISLKLELFFFL